MHTHSAPLGTRFKKILEPAVTQRHSDGLRQLYVPLEMCFVDTSKHTYEISILLVPLLLPLQEIYKIYKTGNLCNVAQVSYFEQLMQ